MYSAFVLNNINSIFVLYCGASGWFVKKVSLGSIWRIDFSDLNLHSHTCNIIYMQQLKPQPVC